MGHEFKAALLAVGGLALWAALFLLHTRVLIPRIIEAQFPGSFTLAVVVGLLGLGLLAWLALIGLRRLAAFYRNR